MKRSRAAADSAALTFSRIVGASGFGGPVQQGVEADVAHERAGLDVDVAFEVDALEAGGVRQAHEVAVVEVRHRRGRRVLELLDRCLDLAGEIGDRGHVVAHEAVGRLGNMSRLIGSNSEILPPARSTRCMAANAAAFSAM